MPLDQDAVPGIETLTLHGFEEFPNVEEYSDFERYPPGFGEDGTDRTERVWFDKESRRWNSVAVHNDLDGNAWYEKSLGDFGTVSDAINWIDRNREVAPRKKAARNRRGPMSEVIRSMLSESSGQSGAVALIEQYKMQRGDTRLRGAIASTLWHEAEQALHARGLTEELKQWLYVIQQGRIDEAIDSVPEEFRASWQSALSKVQLNGLAALVTALQPTE